MKNEYLELMLCPACQSEALHIEALDTEGRIKEGAIHCGGCSAVYPIRNYIPRFSESTPYADSFGPQWKEFARSQIDDERTKESALRFDSEVGWQAADLEGKTAVEFGSGAGRFVDVISRRGAKLMVGLDATDAVDAAQETMGDRDNVLFVQADIFAAPFRKQAFDFGYSIGVLHHTPDPQKGFQILTDLVVPQGEVALSLYEISLYERPNRNSFKVVTMELLWALNMWRCELFRTVTTRLPDQMFLSYCKTVVPVLHHLNKIPVLRYLRYLLPSTCYPHLPVFWSMVDTHDTYATKIVHQYRGRDVFHWFLREGLGNIMLRNSRPGWVSVTATVGDAATRDAQRVIQQRPGQPGLTD